MFGFLKKFFITTMKYFGCTALKCVSVNNQECKIRTKITNINNNFSTFYPYSIEVNNVVAAAIILTIHMQNYVFLVLLKA